MVEVTPEDAIFTKEDLAMYTGLFDSLWREGEFNFATWLKEQTDDPANIKSFIDFINIRKTGALRLQHKTLMVTTIKEELLQLFAIKQNLHSAFVTLPLIGLTITVTVLGQVITLSLPNLGFLKASVNITIPLLEWTIGFATPHQIIIQWEEEIEEFILFKQEYLNSILETPLIEIK